MNGWLLDTNVLSELRRPRPDPNVVQFVSAQPFDLLHVSVVTFAEIRFGIEVATDLSRRMELNYWLIHTARPMFTNRVLEVTEDILVTWRLLVEDGRQTGYTFAQPDLILAATALHHGLTMVSRNTRDFEKAKVPILNPWEPA
ncbi:MAG TPA: type II toxin-antitoxin system VapC family toxin [Thermoanaerobaculia bacterium]